MAEGLLEDILGLHDLRVNDGSAVPRRNKVLVAGVASIADDPVNRETVLTIGESKNWRGVSVLTPQELTNLDADVYRIAEASGGTLWGIGAPSVTGKTLIHIVNATGGNFTLAHENTGAAATSRFKASEGVDVVLQYGEARQALYDFNASRWVIV